LKITYLGHSAFSLEGRGRKVCFDPWVRGNPSAPSGVESLEGADLLMVSHSHDDHGLRDAIEASKRWGGKVVGIFELANYAEREGAMAVGANIGGPFRVEGVEIVLTEALHSSSLGSPVGFVVKLGDLTVYHAGDTGVFPGMAIIGELYKPDIALLPIGGHFTMGPREAAKALEILRPSRVVPMHYGTFPVLWGTPEDLEREVRERGLDVEVVKLEPGESAEV